jgi:hypothetical protein
MLSYFLSTFNYFFVPLFLFLNFIPKLTSTSFKVLNEMFLLETGCCCLYTHFCRSISAPHFTPLLLSQRVLCSVGHVPVTASGCQSLVEDVLHDFILPSFTEFADS